MEDQAKFEGWAVVEIMGHQKHAGYCQTQAFGSAVLLKVTAPEVPLFEMVLAQREWINGELAPADSRIERSRPKTEVLVGMDSIYRITPCSEEAALGSLPFKSVITYRPEVRELPAGEGGGERHAAISPARADASEKVIERPGGLRVVIENESIVIALPLSGLQCAVECCPDLHRYDESTGDFNKPVVTDVSLFAKEVLRQLEDEGEDGSTLVTRMLDRAFCDAIDNGAEGIQMPGDETAGETEAD